MNSFKNAPQFDFFGKAKIFSGVSAAAILVGLISVFANGFNLGVDFEGGTLIQLQFEEPVELEALRSSTEQVFPGGTSVNRFGSESDNEFIAQTGKEAAANGVLRESLSKLGETSLPKFEIRRIETVGPKVGDELKTKAVYSVLVALFCILIYTAFRFRFVYGVGALLALFHDVLITLGIFSLFDLKLDLSIVAAILTIVGYSLNDTIVVFDRIRENLVKKQGSKLPEVINLSVNETLSRTIITALSTFIVVFVLYLFGGEIIKVFSLSLCIGIVVGTYSSVFIACPLVHFLENKLPKKA